MKNPNSNTLTKRILAFFLCLGLLWNFHGSFFAKNETTKNFAKIIFSDGNFDSEEENFESEEVANLVDENYILVKISIKNSGFNNELPVSGFTLAIATPPPDLS
jgi:hypothetical protein